METAEERGGASVTQGFLGLRPGGDGVGVPAPGIWVCDLGTVGCRGVTVQFRGSGFKT